MFDYVLRMAVQQSWQRIVNWLTAHAPETAKGIRPPAGDEDLRGAEAAFPRPWPDDLRQWYRLQNGASSSRLFTGVLPGYAELLSLERIPEASNEYEEIFDEADEEYGDAFEDPETLDQQAAGEFAGRFLRSWVPIGEDDTGCTMFVDCRSGQRSGCVRLFDRDEGDDAPVWASVDAMLTDIADALERGRSCGSYQPQVNNGILEWN